MTRSQSPTTDATGSDHGKSTRKPFLKPRQVSRKEWWLYFAVTFITLLVVREGPGVVRGWLEGRPIELESIAVAGRDGILGHDGTLGRAVDGTYWVWGPGGGLAGLRGPEVARSLWATPVTHDRFPSSIAAVAVGSEVSLVKLEDDSLWVVGERLGSRQSETLITREGQLGLWTFEIIERTLNRSWGDAGIVDMAVGRNHVFIVTDEGELWGWGWTNRACLLDGRHGSDPRLERLLTEFSDLHILSITASDFLITALTNDGTIVIWGQDVETPRECIPPSIVKPVWEGIPVQVAVSNRHVLVLVDDGTVWGWGNNSDSALDIASTDFQDAPVLVMEPWDERRIVSIAAGTGHSIALVDDGTLWRLGHNWMPDTSDLTSDEPDRLQIPQMDTPAWSDRRIVQIAAGEFHVIALADDGSVWAWGANDVGQLGDGTITSRSYPVRVQRQ